MIVEIFVDWPVVVLWPWMDEPSSVGLKLIKSGVIVMLGSVISGKSEVNK